MTNLSQEYVLDIKRRHGPYGRKDGKMDQPAIGENHLSKRRVQWNLDEEVSSHHKTWDIQFLYLQFLIAQEIENRREEKITFQSKNGLVTWPGICLPNG